jgi:uncharacterized protein YjbI with pentapeptide repeats
MSKASYFKGLTIEYDISGPQLIIEGHEKPVRQADGLFQLMMTNLKEKSLFQLAKLVIEHSSEYKRREEVKKEHLQILKESKDHWNAWRQGKPEIRPILFEADLSEVDLNHANFSNADLCEAIFREANLVGASFHQANLGGADLRKAKLNGAKFL